VPFSHHVLHLHKPLTAQALLDELSHSDALIREVAPLPNAPHNALTLHPFNEPLQNNALVLGVVSERLPTKEHGSDLLIKHAMHELLQDSVVASILLAAVLPD
jgi:hypothetical protein